MKTIVGYWYGVHFLPVSCGKIYGLCGVTFDTEEAIIEKYDQVTPVRGPGLVRVYTDGTHFELRPGPLAS